MNQNKTNAPVKRYQAGTLTLGQWSNPFGPTYTLTRKFKRNGSNQWEYTTRLRPADLYHALCLLWTVALDNVEIFTPTATDDDPFKNHEIESVRGGNDV